MTTRLMRPLAVVASVALSTPLAASAQDSTTKTECVKSYEAAQKLRKDAKLVAARKELMLCARPTCPEVVTADCVGWLSEVEKEIPSIVVSAKDSKGNDTLDVRVTIDGQVSSEKLSATAIYLDPGPHDLRFEHEDNVIERQLVLVQGEQNRAVVISFQNQTTAKPDDGDDSTKGDDSGKSPVDSPSEPGEGSGGFPYWPMGVSAGLTVAAVLPWAIYGAQVSGKKSDYDDSLGVETVERQQELKSDLEDTITMANVFMGVAIVGAAATVTFLTIALITDDDGSSEDEKTVSWHLAPVIDPRGSLLGGQLIGQF